jgi:hypothetical protein
MAEKRGIGTRQLEHAKETLGVTVQRLDNGRVCLALSSQIEPEKAQQRCKFSRRSQMKLGGLRSLTRHTNT